VTNAPILGAVPEINTPYGLVAGGKYNRNGNLTGVPRTLRMSFGAKF
jgi:hypothetical protein